MPVKPKRPYSQIGCPRLTAEKYCGEHKKETSRKYNSRQRYVKKLYRSIWRKVRLTYLRIYPPYMICHREGRLTAANVVDHVVPHRGDAGIYWVQKQLAITL